MKKTSITCQNVFPQFLFDTESNFFKEVLVENNDNDFNLALHKKIRTVLTGIVDNFSFIKCCQKQKVLIYSESA